MKNHNNLSFKFIKVFDMPTLIVLGKTERERLCQIAR